MTQPVPRRLAPSRRAERSEAPAPEVEKPLILVDFHKTVSFEGIGIPEGVIQDLQSCLHKGFALGILSFGIARVNAARSASRGEFVEEETQLSVWWRPIAVVSDQNKVLI